MNYISVIKEILKDNFGYRRTIPKLAASDLKKTYSGSLLGWSWAVIRPAILIFVFWFAYSVGLRKGNDKDGFPVFLWLIAGMIPWYFMRDMLTGGANCIRRFKYLVTKIKFPVSTIPNIVTSSNMVSHMGLVIIMIVLYWVLGFPPTIYYLQLPFYMFIMYMFWTAWALFAGMLSSVSTDFLNLVKSLTQALFWLSGILYDVADLGSATLRKVLMFNPITIIVNGYRDTFMYHVWFWERAESMRNFALLYLVMCLLAIWAYKKLRKEIPDVL